MGRIKASPRLLNLASIGAIAGIVGIPLAIFFWWRPRSPNTEIEKSTWMSSAGENSPVVNAGRDANVGVVTEATSPSNPAPDTDLPAKAEADERMSSKGDNSPVVKAGRDAIVNMVPAKPDYITAHNGAGALLMREPNFREFISASISGQGPEVIARLINGTSLKLIEQKEGTPGESPPWVKVSVLEGPMAGQSGWILADAVRKP